MKNKITTLRVMLELCDRNEVYKFLHKKYMQDKVKDVPFEKTVKMYSKVIKELLSYPKVRPYKMRICVSKIVEDKDMFYDVCLLNPKFVEPPKGTKPWGGKNPPKGYYNINLSKYNKYYALGLPKWSTLIDTHVVNDAKLSADELLAEILWEFTFYGFTQKQIDEFSDGLKEQVKTIKKEIKEGKCTTIPRKTKEQYDIVIPDTVKKQITKLSKK